MDPDLLRRRLADARVARFATVDGAGNPHLVPVCFVVDDDAVYWAVDHKPKATRRLRRLANIEVRPGAELLVDHYAENWSELWWIRVSGAAAVLQPGAETEHALDLLAAKYEQYREHRPDGPVVRLSLRRRSGWSFAP